jgi:hypothetical protein
VDKFVIEIPFSYKFSLFHQIENYLYYFKHAGNCADGVKIDHHPILSAIHVFECFKTEFLVVGKQWQLKTLIHDASFNVFLQLLQSQSYPSLFMDGFHMNIAKNSLIISLFKVIRINSNYFSDEILYTNLSGLF